MACQISTLLSAVILIGAPAVGAQNTPAADCPALVLAAFAATGTDQAIRNMTSGIQTGMAAQTQVRITAAAFSLEAIQQDFRTEFVNSCNPETLRGVIALMNSPLAIRMRDLESASRTPESRRKLDQFVDGLIQAPLPNSRLLLIKRLDEAEGSSALLNDSLRAAIRGFTSAEASVPKPNLDKLRNMMFVAWLFAYRDVGDAELGQYVDILESPPMKSFNSIFRLTFLGVITTQSREMGRQLGLNKSASR